MRKQPPRIHGSVEAICRKLGLDPSQVGKLTITPTEVKAMVYLLNEDGNKYVVPSRYGTRPATKTQKFEVRA